MTTKPAIIWPEAWNATEGWPTYAAVLLTDEKRTWRGLVGGLKDGSLLVSCITNLGGPKGNRPAGIKHRKTPTLPEVEAQIRAYYEQHKTCPMSKTSLDWRATDNWLANHHNTTLRKLCCDLKLREAPIVSTIESIEREMRAYAAANKGARPQAGTNREWKNVNQRLGYLKSSLAKLCPELRSNRSHTRKALLPPTLANIESDIRVYVAANDGRRPTQVTNVGWGRKNSWLRNQGTSLAKFCDKMGVKKTARTGHSKTGVPNLP